MDETIQLIQINLYCKYFDLLPSLSLKWESVTNIDSFGEQIILNFSSTGNINNWITNKNIINKSNNIGL